MSVTLAVNIWLGITRERLGKFTQTVNDECLKYGKDLRGFQALDNKGKAQEVYSKR